MKIVESNQSPLLSTIASFIYKNDALSFHIADMWSLSSMVDQCTEYGQQHPGCKSEAPNSLRHRDGANLWSRPTS